METIHDIDGSAEQKARSVLARVEAAITAHPLPAVGAAFALGAIAGLARKAMKGDGERSIGGMVVAGIGAVALRLAKSYAFSRLGDAAKSWLVDEYRGTAPSDTERAASREPAIESFVRH